VVSTFADEIAKAWKENGGTSEDACTLVDMYAGLDGLVVELEKEKVQLDTEQLAEIAKRGNRLAFGKEKPIGDKPFLSALMQAELLKRGITTDTDGNGKHDIVPVDYAKWHGFYSDVIKGLSQ
jgi:hypothetical protein